MPRLGLAILLAVVALLRVPAPARAYVDLASTLSRIASEGQTITLVEVEKFNREKGAVILKKVRDLKGKTSDDPIKHQVGRLPGAVVPRLIHEWAEPGRRGVYFVSGNIGLVCVGQGWYQIQTSGDGWWKLGPDRPDLPLSYYGSVSRLTDAVEQMLAGKTTIITTLPHGAEEEGASFDLALNRTALPGLVRLERIRANLRMPGVVMAVANNPMYLVGPGAAGEEEIPALIEKLKSPDATVREEAADDLRTLAPKAGPASAMLTTLLDDPSSAVRSSAAAALLRISPKNDRAVEILAKDLAGKDPIARRHAARAAGLAGSASTPLVTTLGALLADSDELTRLASLQAIATLGHDAAPAFEAVNKLLDDPAIAIDAADALGRIGPAAQSANPRIARMLESTEPTVRWAAIRAMCQIGGDSAAPAVDAIVKVLKNNPTEVDGYNSMIYIGLLGPVAKPAIPTIESTRIKNPVLGQFAIWAIDPTRFPWMSTGNNARFGGAMMRDAEFARWIGESFLLECGDRFKPAAAALAVKIMDGTAGELPWIGYRLLARFPDPAIEKITPALKHKDLAVRERATVTLGFMGAVAAPAKAEVAEALKAATTDREKKLIQWCLRQMGDNGGEKLEARSEK